MRVGLVRALQCATRRGPKVARRAPALSMASGSRQNWSNVWSSEEGADVNYEKLPKVELHRHLEGAVRLRTILEEARRHQVDHLPGVSLHDTKQVFDYFDVSGTGRVSAEDFLRASREMGIQATPQQASALIESQFPSSSNSMVVGSQAPRELEFDQFSHLMESLMLSELRPYVLTDSPFPDLKSLLDRFDRTQSVFKDMKTFERIAFESVEDAYNEGVRLLELRYAPSFCSMEHDHDFGAVLRAVQAGVAAATERYDIQVGLICIAVGAMGPEQVEKTIDFLLDNRDAFVGFDLAGAETELSQWAPMFRRVSDANIPITCHASEDRTTGLPTNAVVAIESLGATRIGHGVQIVQDKRAMEAVRAHGVLLEVSVSSNYLCGCFPSVEAHPARKLWDFGIPLSINTDDPGIMALDMAGEYAIWHNTLGFDPTEMLASNHNALDHSFLDKENVERVRAAYF